MAVARTRANPVAASPLVRGIAVTHPERVMYPDDGLTKLDLVRYYDVVAEAMLPHLAGRPLTLKQCAPDASQCRYLRHSGERAPAQVRVVNIQEKTKVGDYMVIDDAAGLIALSQRNIVEFHTWNATTEHVERPDGVVFDLDPGPGVPWRTLVEAARLVRRALQGVGLESWVKTTGGAGLHVVAPIRPTHDWSVCLAFARTVAESLVAHRSSHLHHPLRQGRPPTAGPRRLPPQQPHEHVGGGVVDSCPARRVGVDAAHLGGTRAAAHPRAFTVTSVPRRWRRRQSAWAGYFEARQALPVRSTLRAAAPPA